MPTPSYFQQQVAGRRCAGLPASDRRCVACIQCVRCLHCLQCLEGCGLAQSLLWPLSIYAATCCASVIPCLTRFSIAAGFVQCPLHSSMDTATSRSMTVLVGQARLCPPPPFSRHSRSTRRTQTSSFRAQSRNPSPPANTSTRKSSAPALHYGYCDFAQYDGVGRASASLSSATLLPSFPKYPPNPNFVIPRAVAESISACQRINQKIQCPCTPLWILRLRAV